MNGFRSPVVWSATAVALILQAPSRAQQQGGGQGQAGQLAGADVADDGGVSQYVQGLGQERPEGGHGQPGDGQVVGGAEPAQATSAQLRRQVVRATDTPAVTRGMATA